MREIKFRAWDENKKEVVEPLIPLGAGLMPMNKIFEMYKTYTWMQYTGLKDKNGKEIYEGDLVRYTIPEDVPENERDVRKVIWVDGMCGFQGRTLNDRFDCFLDTETFEVIGNIYENPELLRSKDEV